MSWISVHVTGSSTPSQSKSKKVYLGGLPAGCTKGDKSQALRQFGEISVSHY